MDKTLFPFFNPKSVVIIGASTNPVKPGFGVARNVAESGYQGKIFYVSQKEGTLFGHKIYTNVSEVPEPIDLAVIVVPAAAVNRSLEDCAKHNIKAAIVLSGGFKETGKEGATLEEELSNITRSNGVRTIGPNCVGMIDTHLPLDISFLPPPLPPTGGVAVLSQSGSMMAILIDWARIEQVGFSCLLSLGNKTDINEADIISAVAEQEETRLVVMYIEALTDGQRFLEETRKVTDKIPIIALKVGRGEAGQRAAASHTGALAGSDTAYQKAFERAGILQAKTSDELFDWIIAFTRCPLPRGRRVAILTNAGGPGVIASDSVEAYGLQLADLSASTLSAFREFLPPATSFHNPLDMLASASPQNYGRALGLLLADPNVDSIVVLLPAPPMFPAEEVVDAMLPVIKTASKPVIINLLGLERIGKALDKLRNEKVAVYLSTERAIAALSGLTRRSEFINSNKMPESILTENILVPVDCSLDSAVQGSWLGPQLVERLMNAFDIPTSPIRSASTPEEAAILASELGFPIVIKIASPDIVHKSDVGGVLVGLRTPEEVVDGFKLVTERAHKAKPQARIDGVLIQQMIPSGQEVIVGATRDNIFGPVMMFGSGGVEVEGLQDVAFDLAPLDKSHAERIMAETWAGKKLTGFRSIPPADTAAARDVLINLARLVHNYPQITEIEINPLRVLSPGEGAVAVDVRIRL